MKEIFCYHKGNYIDFDDLVIPPIKGKIITFNGPKGRVVFQELNNTNVHYVYLQQIRDIKEIEDYSI